MGEYAELDLENAERSALFASDPDISKFMFGIPAKNQSVIWVTKNGRRVDIKDMTTLHLKFSLAKCKRDNWRLEAIPYLEKELKSRKD